MTTNTEIKTAEARLGEFGTFILGSTTMLQGDRALTAALKEERAELRAALEAAQQQVAGLKRDNLELTRRYEEQKLQEKRLDAALERSQQVAQRAGSGAKPQEHFYHYGLSAEQVQQLLASGLKPEEISGADDVQHDRVHELVWWFARLTQGNANPKWAVRHACELAYFIATNGINRNVDLKAVRDAAFKEGVNITPEERGTLERIGFATPRPAPPPAAVQPEEYLPMSSAPKDGTILRLMVAFTDNATEDDPGACPTIGANNFDHDGIDVWKFAGWDWSQDCFTEGHGKPIGWLPMLAAKQPDSGRDAALLEAAKIAENIGRPVGAGDGCTYVPGTSADAARAIRAAMAAQQGEKGTQ